MPSHDTKKYVKESYDRKYSLPTSELAGPVKYRQMIEIPLVLQSLGKKSGIILDAGCGDCRIASALTVSDGLIVGVDFSLAGLDRARQRVSTMKLVLADIEHLPFKKAIFHEIVCIGTFEYFSSIDPTLSQFHHIIRPDGYLTFNVRHMRRLVSIIGRIARIMNRSNTLKAQYHVQRYNRSQVLKSLRNNQFLVDRIYGYFVLLPEQAAKLADTLSLNSSNASRVLTLLAKLDRLIGRSRIGMGLCCVAGITARRE